MYTGRGGATYSDVPCLTDPTRPADYDCNKESSRTELSQCRTLHAAERTAYAVFPSCPVGVGRGRAARDQVCLAWLKPRQVQCACRYGLPPIARDYCWFVLQKVYITPLNFVVSSKTPLIFKFVWFTSSNS